MSAELTAEVATQTAMGGEEAAVRQDHVRAPHTVLSTERQVWFGPEERPLFGFLSLPSNGHARAGVVLCSPMGEEGRATHRTFRRVAEELASAGVVSLRFDYDGCGDSAGLQDDPDRVPSWLASIAAAREVLVEMGLHHISAMGMRMGATLLSQAAADGLAEGADGTSSGFESLVLWDPCATGSGFLKEGAALHAFAGHAPDVSDGRVHTPGFQYDAETVAGVKQLKMADLDQRHPLAEHVLLLTREDRPFSPRVLTRLQQEGERLETGIAVDQDLLLDLTPSLCHVPERAVSTVAGWLSGHAADADEVSLKLPEQRAARMRSAGADSVEVVERGVLLAEGHVFGVVTEPFHSDAFDGPAPWVVMVNVAIERHVGPGRRWVEYAREWAALGFRCVRVDQSSCGDSPTRTLQHDDDLYSPYWIDDLTGVARELAADGAPVCLFGLCSGAVGSIEAAHHTPVDAAFLINVAHTLHSAAPGSRIYRSDRAFSVPTRPIAALARRYWLPGVAAWRIYRQFAFWHAPVLLLRNIARRGTTVHLVGQSDDLGRFDEVAVWKVFRPREIRRGKVVIHVDEGIDHSLLTLAAQQNVRRRATRFLTDRYRPRPPGQAAAARN